MKSGVFRLAFLAVILLSVSELSAAPRKSYSAKSYNQNYYPSKNYNYNYSKKPYSKKAPYAGYGKPSKVNGLPKTKITSGHVKKTSKGYTHVNPYARSK